MRGGRGGSGGTAAVLVTVAALAMTACGNDGRAAGTHRVDRALFDSTGTWVHAGVSARTRVEVPPLRPAALGADTAGRAFHLYQTRCGSCHLPPDPAMKSGEHWSFLVRRMQDKTRTAGLLPMTDAEADSIMALLRKHGSR